MKNRHTVVISDGHANSTQALCPPTIQLEGGGIYNANKYQKYLWDCWLDFCAQVPLDSLVIVNGDWVHGAKSNKDSEIITSNKATMREIARRNLEPLTKRKPSELYFVRGTEWHESTGGEDLETVASMFPQTVAMNGHYSQLELWLRIYGKDFHFAHHISMGRGAGFKEMDTAVAEFVKHDQPMPDYDFRSHRHVYAPYSDGRHHLIVTPGWQLRTAFTVKINVLSYPDIGGIIVSSNNGRIHVDPILYPLPKPQIHTPK